MTNLGINDNYYGSLNNMFRPSQDPFPVHPMTSHEKFSKSRQGNKGAKADSFGYRSMGRRPHPVKGNFINFVTIGTSSDALVSAHRTNSLSVTNQVSDRRVNLSNEREARDSSPTLDPDNTQTKMDLKEEKPFKI